MSEVKQASDANEVINQPVHDAEHDLLIPEAEQTAIIALDNTVTKYRAALSNPDLGDMMRVALQARAIVAIEAMITPGMMKDFRALMNSQLGFKTDQDPNRPSRSNPNPQPYDDKTMVRCLIVAFLAGGLVVNNQINIISGQCYFAKEFYNAALRGWPGFTHLQITLGAPTKFGEKSSAVEAKASWRLNGKQHEILCIKGDPAEGEIDSRIIVITNEYMSPDAVQGKAEKKLLARIHHRLTGINTDVDEEIDAPLTITQTKTTESIKGEQRPVVGVEPEGDQENGEIDDNLAATKLFLEIVGSIDKAPDIQTVTTIGNTRKKDINSADWSEELKRETRSKVDAAIKAKIEAIRGGRGGRSND